MQYDIDDYLEAGRSLRMARWTKAHLPRAAVQGSFAPGETLSGPDPQGPATYSEGLDID